MAAFSRLKHDPEVLHILAFKFKRKLNSATSGNIATSCTFSSHSARLDVAPTFYQTLAGVTHLEEQEIAELEKRFWALAQDSSSGLIDRFDSLNSNVREAMSSCNCPKFQIAVNGSGINLVNHNLDSRKQGF